MRRKFYEIKNIESYFVTGEKENQYEESDLKSTINKVINLVRELQDTEEDYDKNIYKGSTKERAIDILMNIYNKIEDKK